MRQRRDERFERERRDFALRFTCEDCVHQDADTGECVHMYPNSEHRLSYYDSPGEWLLFCKDFDLA